MKGSVTHLLLVPVKKGVVMRWQWAHIRRGEVVLRSISIMLPVVLILLGGSMVYIIQVLAT